MDSSLQFTSGNYGEINLFLSPNEGAWLARKRTKHDITFLCEILIETISQSGGYDWSIEITTRR